MVWKLFQCQENSAPYSVLAERIMLEVLSGKAAPGQKLPSIRKLAEDNGVSPTTAQRALDALQREGIVTTHRTIGKYITSNEQFILRWKNKYMKMQLAALAANLNKAGFSESEIRHGITKQFLKNAV